MKHPILYFFLLSYLLFIGNGCTFYLFDPHYYKAKKIAKQYSGTYVVDKKLYIEIMQLQNSKEYKESELAFQKDLQTQIRHNQNSEWNANKDKYQAIAQQKSGYKNIKNAQSLFILEKTYQKFANHRMLSNGKTYYNYVTMDTIVIPESYLQQVITTLPKDFKLKRIVYPQYFYKDDNGSIHIISFGIIYLYTNINKIYGLQQDSNMMFANGEWKYLQNNNVFYLDDRKN